MAMTTVYAKIKGETLAEFRLDGDAARLHLFSCETLGGVFSRANYVFLSEEHWQESPEYTMAIMKSGTKWAVTINVRYVAGGVFHTLTWAAGEFAGTRGVALYRAFLAFGDAMAAGKIAEQLKQDAAERAAQSQVLSGAAEDAFITAVFAPELGIDGLPWEPGDNPARRMPDETVVYDAREESAPAPVAPEAAETARRAEAVRAWYAAGNGPSPEIAALPDPHVSGGAWGGHEGAAEGGITPCGEWVEQTSKRGKVTRKFVKPLEPVAGSDADGVQGKCPDCRAVVALTDSGTLSKHNRYGEAVPAPKGLTSKSVDNVDHGSVPGSPATADKRVAEQIKADGASSGTFSGKYRAAQRDHGHVDGSANTGRANMAPVQPKRGWLATAGTGALSMTVRPGVDAVVAGKFCPVCNGLVEVVHAGMSRAARRKHSVRVAKWHREQAELREARKAREVARGEALPSEERRALRKAASIGSSASGTIAAAGVIVPIAPEELAENAVVARRSAKLARKADREFAAEGARVSK